MQHIQTETNASSSAKVLLVRGRRTVGRVGAVTEAMAAAEMVGEKVAVASLVGLLVAVVKAGTETRSCE